MEEIKIDEGQMEAGESESSLLWEPCEKPWNDRKYETKLMDRKRR